MAGTTTTAPKAAFKMPPQRSDDVARRLVLTANAVPTSEPKVATTKRQCWCTDDSDDDDDAANSRGPRARTVLWTVTEQLRRAAEEQRRRPLVLVLDLDHTLLHTVGAHRLSRNELYLLARQEPPAVLDERPPTLLFNNADKLGYITKLRPFVHSFLGAASTMFRLCVCTMGVRNYAYQMVRLLDPDGRFFAPGDVISREDYRKRCIKDLDSVRWGDERTTLILDDTVDVWAMRHQHNLIKMPAYNYFAADGGRGTAGRSGSLAEMGMDEEEGSCALARALFLLWEIHRAFFFDPDAVKDVRVLLRRRTRPLEFLDGRIVVVRIVFFLHGKQHPFLLSGKGSVSRRLLLLSMETTSHHSTSASCAAVVMMMMSHPNFFDSEHLRLDVRVLLRRQRRPLDFLGGRIVVVRIVFFLHRKRHPFYSLEKKLLDGRIVVVRIFLHRKRHPF